MHEVKGFSLKKSFMVGLIVGLFLTLTLGVLRFHVARLAYHLDMLNLSIKRYADEETLLRQELSALVAPIKIYSYCKERLGMQKVTVVETLPIQFRGSRLVADRPPEQGWRSPLAWLFGSSR